MTKRFDITKLELHTMLTGYTKYPNVLYTLLHELPFTITKKDEYQVICEHQQVGFAAICRIDEQAKTAEYISIISN